MWAREPSARSDRALRTHRGSAAALTRARPPPRTPTIPQAALWRQRVRALHRAAPVRAHHKGKGRMSLQHGRWHPSLTLPAAACAPPGQARAKETYGVTDGDLKSLGSMTKANPKNKSWQDMRLYLQSQVRAQRAHRLQPLPTLAAARE